MTAAEFIQTNADILTGVMKNADFEALTDGSVVFMLTTTPGNKNIQDRVVRNAGYYLVVSTHRNHLGKLVDITIVGLTAGGYAKVDSFNLGDLEYKRNKMLFLCRPLPQNDPRSNYKFVR